MYSKGRDTLLAYSLALYNDFIVLKHISSHAGTSLIRPIIFEARNEFICGPANYWNGPQRTATDHNGPEWTPERTWKFKKEILTKSVAIGPSFTILIHGNTFLHEINMGSI